jgi:hypothetical protein
MSRIDRDSVRIMVRRVLLSGGKKSLKEIRAEVQAGITYQGKIDSALNAVLSDAVTKRQIVKHDKEGKFDKFEIPIGYKGWGYTYDYLPEE